MSKSVECLVDLGLKSGRLAGPMRLALGRARICVSDEEGLYIPTELSETMPDNDKGTEKPGAQRCVVSLGAPGNNPRFYDWRDVLILDKENAQNLHEQLGNILSKWK